MNGLLVCAVTLELVAIVSIGWLGWQLLRQNGRILLRLEELEKRVNDFEFGDGPELSGLPLGSEAPAFAAENGSARLEGPKGPGSVAAGNGNGREHRFRERSLARSKIKRDGLKAGTPAPDFRLPRLDGRGEVSLSGLRGRPVLLVFSSPSCGPCLTLAPRLEEFHREHPEIELVMISKGEPKENRAKVKEFGLTFPIVLQQQWEISRLYAMFATPVAYLVDERGVIARDVAVGVEPILALVAAADARRL